MAGHDPKLGEDQDIFDLKDRREVHRAARVDDQHEFLILLVGRQYIPDLGLGQVHVALNVPAVVALAGDPGEHVDGHVAVAGQRQLILGLRHHRAHARDHDVHLAALRIGLEILYKLLLCVLYDRLKALHPLVRRDRETGLPEAVLDRHEEAGVDLAGTRAALDRASRAAPVESDLPRRSEREVPVRLKEHGALGA